MIYHLDRWVLDAQIVQTVWIKVIEAKAHVDHTVRSIFCCFLGQEVDRMIA